jgi:hypothetical protein
MKAGKFAQSRNQPRMVLPLVRIDRLQVNLNTNFKAQRGILQGPIQNPAGEAVKTAGVGEKGSSVLSMLKCYEDSEHLS